MASVLTSKALINTIKRRAFIPRDQATFSDADFLEMATEEINIGLMEQILTARGDYLVYHLDFALPTDVKRFPIPSRAHGNKLRDCAIVDDNPDPSKRQVIWEMTQITVEDLSDYSQNYTMPSYNTKIPFYLENNEVVLINTAQSSGNMLRMYFYMRPNALVTNDRAGTVMSIADGVEGTDNVKIVSFATMPKHFNTTITYDVVQSQSPNKIKDWDLTPVSVNNTLKTISFLATDDLNLSVGDYITQSEETIVPNIPTEYHPVVAQRVAVACLEAMGDEQNKQSAERKLEQMSRAVLKIVENRVEGAPKKINNRNGTLRQGTASGTFRRWGR